MEIEANDKIAGKTVQELNLPGELSIVAIVKKKIGQKAQRASSKEDAFISGPQDKVERDDLLIGVIRPQSLAKVKKVLGLN